MKNTLISTLIFVILLSFVYYANTKLINLCDYVTNTSNDITNLINEENYESAYETSTKLAKYIKDNTLMTAIYINHSDFDELISESNELCIYTKNKNRIESEIAAMSLHDNAQNIKHLHKPSIENIL